MMGSDEILVVLCSYQGQRFIGAQIDSILSQSYKNIKLHVFDDCSTDATQEIIKQYQHCKNVFLHFNAKNIGFINNFESALQIMNGQYFALSDQDDIWHPDKLLLSMKAMKQLEKSYRDMPLLVHSDLSYIDAFGKHYHNSYFNKKGLIFSDKQSLSKIMGHCGVMGNTILMNRLLVDIALPFPEGLKYHDYWLALVNEFFGVRKTIKKSLVQYRMHGNNVSNNTLSPGRKKLSTKWLKLDFALPFLEDNRAETIRYFLDHYIFSAEDRLFVEYYYQYLLFRKNRLSHYIFLIRNNFLKPSLSYRISVFFRMMLTTRYAGHTSLGQQIKRKR
jgi:rhamnosyltransferase